LDQANTLLRVNQKIKKYNKGLWLYFCTNLLWQFLGDNLTNLTFSLGGDNIWNYD